MKNSMSHFAKTFSYYTITILLISFIIQQWVPAVKISSTWPFVLLFLYIFTLIAFRILVKYLTTKLTYFANAFMLVNFGKLVFFSIIIVVYAWFMRSDAISFTVTFFIYYLLLTTFEVVALLKLQKKPD